MVHQFLKKSQIPLALAWTLKSQNPLCSPNFTYQHPFIRSIPHIFTWNSNAQNIITRSNLKIMFQTIPSSTWTLIWTHVIIHLIEVPTKTWHTTLKGPALEWFTTLLPYSIDSFDVLSYIFSTHFAGSRPHQTTTISLLGIRQDQGELLRAFIDRFSKGMT